MDELSDLIHVYEDCLENNVCDVFISLFEELEDKHERLNNQGRPNFTQINLTENRDINSDVSRVHNHIIKKIFEYRDKYYDYIDKRVFPDEHALEQFRIKRYNPGGEERFDTHVDVVNHDTSRRFLAFLWYLNDVEEGGKTIFKDFEVKPKKGTLVMFPPFWMYPHYGEPPISSSKYIMSTYLHYK